MSTLNIYAWQIVGQLTLKVHEGLQQTQLPVETEILQ